MSFLDDLLARGKSLFEKPPVPDATDAVQHDRWDEREWEQVRQNVPQVNRTIETLRVKHDQVPDAFQDIYNLMFKSDPKIRQPEEMKGTHRANQVISSELDKLPEVQRLRQHSRGDTYGSAMALMAMKEQIGESYVKVEEAMKQAVEDEAAAQEAAQQAADEAAEAMASLAMAPQGPPGAAPSKGEQSAAAKMDQFDKAQQGAEQAAEKAQQAGQQAAETMAAGFRATAAETADELDKDEALCQAFGVDEGQLQKMSFEERFELAKRLRSNRLADFMKILGQFKMVQQAESRRKVMHASTEIHGVELSDDLTKLTVGEYLSFADPVLELLFWSRWAEHSLLTYDVRGTEKQGQGPVIIVVDESGSMGCADCGGATREAWSKALALAMVDQARQKGRNAHYIGFSSSREQHRVDFPKGEASIEKVMEMTEHFYGGGTHYETPLGMALDLVEQEYDSAGLPKPDIVFITDDAYTDLNPEFMNRWNRVKDKTSLRCFGIAVGCDVSGALASVSDDVREITEMASDPRVMADLFRTV